MTNPYENRLHQIEILLHAYRQAEEEYPEEITNLEEERTGILLELKYKE